MNVYLIEAEQRIRAMPAQRQAIIRTHAGILLIGYLGTIFIEILIEIITKMHL